MAYDMHWIAAALLIVGLGSAAAQQPAARKTAAARAHDHDHPHLTERDIKLPQDFASAVARLRACGGSLQSELDAKRYDAAHAALDEAQIVLGKLMPLARDSGVPKSKWAEVNLAGKDLKKRFGQIDDVLHRTGRADLQAAAKPIDEALRKLEAVAADHGSTRQAMKP